MALTIESKYRIVDKLGEGAFGKIFRGVNTNTDAEVAIKVDKEEGGVLLRNEARIYRHLSGLVGIPTMRSFGVEGKFTYLVMDLLGNTLEDTRKLQGDAMSPRMVVLVGLQMLKRLEELHKKGIIHRDVKPDNFIFGVNEAKSTLHIVDFGLAKFYTDDTGKHIALDTGRKLTGTSRYASLSVHRGNTPSRRDDLESLGYVMLYLLGGELPWQGLTISESERNVVVAELKSECKLWEQFGKYPGEFVTYIQYCRRLGFEEEPNYTYLTGLLKNLQRILEPVAQ